MAQAPVVLSNGKTQTTAIAPQRSYNTFPVKRHQTVTIRQENEILEELVVGKPPLDFAEKEDDRILYIIGGPADLVLADYSDFYVAEGQDPPPNPHIKDIVNLRSQKAYHIRRSDELWWPYQTVPETVYSGGGWDDRRIIRVIPVSQNISDAQIPAYLDYELKRQLQDLQQQKPN
jgi:hypothetical protein